MNSRIAKLAVFLLLGALVNVAVSWGLANFQEAMPMRIAPFPEGISHADGLAWHVQHVRQPGTDLVLLYPMERLPPRVSRPTGDAYADLSAKTEYLAKLDKWQRGEPIAQDRNLDVIAPAYWSLARTRPAPVERTYPWLIQEVGGWRSPATRPASARGEYEELIEEARGWPMRSVKCVLRWKRDARNARLPGSVQEWALPLGGVQGTSGLPRRLPLKPIWAGFAVNTILYAAVLWLLFIATASIRRWRRVRHGLCPACAYPVGESTVCSECGKSVRPRGLEAEA